MAALASLAACSAVLALGVGSAVAATEFGEEGEHAGQFRSPFGLAVNQETGDVFVADQYNWRVDRFQGSGSFSLAWGWHVEQEAPAEELQTCTASCESGRPGMGPGTFASEGPHGVAVDNNALSPSHGDVYVTDWENYRVEKFGPQGEFMLMFGGGVITGGATGTGTLTAPSNTCSEACAKTITSVTTTSRAFLEGQTITGAGIPPGTTILHVGDPSSNDVGTLTLSQPATASGSGVALTVAAGVGAVPNNESQTVTVDGTPTGGSFTLEFTSPTPDSSEATTAPIAYNAEPSGPGSVQEALEALPNIGAGNVAVSGAAGGPYTVEFTGARYADTNVKELQASAEGLEPAGEEFVSVATAVEGHSTPEVCATASICQGGAKGTADGQFAWAYSGNYIAVGPGGDVYVGDRARVQVFEPSGAWKANISLAGLASEGAVTALAVDAVGDVFLKDQESSGVREFAPDGTEMLTQFDEGSFSIAAVTLDAAGNVYVADTQQAFHVLKYDPTGKLLGSFGAGAVGFFQGGMAFSDATGQLYVADTQADDVKVLAASPSGPLISGESGTAGLHGEATLAGTLNPEGHETTYHFEYLTEGQYAEDGDTFGAGTVSTSPATLAGTEFEGEQVEAKLPEGTLVPGQVYRWRLVASNECEESRTCTTDGAPQTLEETPPAQIDGPWATGVTATSATLAARIDPQGASTSFRLQYGTSTAYEHEFTGSLAAGTEFVAVGGYPVQELKPGTTYHFRVVTVNECITGKTCTQDGADHTFTTRPGASEFALPDGRVWELVTPANTEGAVLERQPPIRAASDGSAIVYGGSGTLGGNAQSNVGGANVLARRGSEGWASQDINTPVKPPKEGETPNLFGTQRFDLFSPDLASALFDPQVGEEVLTADALETTTYLRNLTCTTGEATSCYTPLLSSANTPPGTELTRTVEAAGGSGIQTERESNIVTSTPDLAHVVLGSPLVLTAGAHEYTPPELIHGYGNLYEWSAGPLQLVDILPSGKTNEFQGALLAGQNGVGSGDVPRAISSDGRRIAWTVGTPYPGGFKALYVRDMADEKTVHLGEFGARYQTMSSDGSRVFFLEHGDLYEYHVAPGASYDAGTTTDLTASHGPGEASAGVQEFVTDVSEDGSYAYFVATGVLSSARNATGEKALAGGDNLYVLHNQGGTWEAPQFIARLSSEDEKSWGFHEPGSGSDRLSDVTSRVSPDGRYLAFMSSRSLTGYDNVDLNPEAKGAHDEEVFLYHAPQHLAAESGSLICASCDPSGARPHGVPGVESLATTFTHAEWQGHWLAGNLPVWESGNGRTNQMEYQPRYLSDSGRLFFNSPIALVPHDTNGLEDVYQYEPAGVGGASGCASSSATYSARTGGCADLISSGQSAFESAFMDASENGNDVFFLTSDRLTAGDIDTGYDVWGAHVCSSSSPCTVPPVSPPPCSEESCRGAASPQPELFGAPPSATFSGAGNVAPASKPAVKPKVLTRAQKLAKALGSCRKKYKRSKKRRAACERGAHKRYGHAAKRSRTANATDRRGK